MGVLSNNYSHIVPGALISASYVSDIYDVLMGMEREDIMLSGSLNVTGSIYGNLIGLATTAITASYVLDYSASLVGTASYAQTATSASHAINSDTASYITFNNVDNLTAFSSSIDSRTVELENFSSSIDNFFVNETQFSSFTSSYFNDSGSSDTRITNLENFSSSIDNVFVSETEFATFTSSYYNDSSSFDTRILNNSSSIDSLSSNFILFSGSYNTGSFTGSFNGEFTGIATNAVSSSYSKTASYVEILNQNVLISGSLTVLGGATIFGSSSFLYVTASQLAVSSSYISVNVFEPLQRFGGIYVFDSGSSNATASLTWDSLNDRWVYTNVSGAAYEGGMLLSGPRNFSGLGNEPSLTKWFIPRSDGTDHLDNSQIYSSGSVTIVTGSLTVTNGITSSLQGTAATASYVLNAVSSSYSVSSSFAQNSLNAATASYVSTLAGIQYYIPRFDFGYGLTNSQIYDNGSNVLIGAIGSNTDKVQIYNNTTGYTALRINNNKVGDILVLQTSSKEIFSVATSGLIKASGSLIMTGSIIGTPGVVNDLTSSYAMTTSFATTSQNSNTASFVQTAQTASYVVTAQTASYVLNAISSSFATSSSFAITSSFTLSSSFASTASYTPNALVTASVSSNVITFTKGNGTTFPIIIATGSGNAIQILDEGVSLTTNVSSINFSGSLVTATTSGNNVTVAVPGLTYYSSSAAVAGAATGSTVGIIYNPSTITTPATGTYMINVTTDITNTGTTGQFIEISIYYGAAEQTETIVRVTNVANQTQRASIATHKILTVDGLTNVSFGLRTGANANAWTINRFVLTMVKIS